MTVESVNDNADRKKIYPQSSSRTSNGFCQYLITGLPPSTVLLAMLLFALAGEFQSAEATTLPPPPQLIRPQNISSDIQFLYNGKIFGPESFVLDGDHIYVGAPDGWVKDYHNGQIRNIARFTKQPCNASIPGALCGRPLGIRLENEGSLIVVDTEYGLFRVNITTGQYEQLYDSKTPVNGKPSLFLNDVDIGLDGSVYFTDSSTKWTRNGILNIILEDSGSGRLMKYSPVTKKTEELMGGLLFANGVQMTHDKSAVLVAEFGAARIHKYDLKTKHSSVWADNLSGFPDNIRYSSETGTYWIGFGRVRIAGQFSIIDLIRNKPWLRAILKQTAGCSGLKSLLHQSHQPDLALEVDKYGNVIRGLFDALGRMSGISEVQVSNGFAYFGSISAFHMEKLVLPSSTDDGHLG